MPSDAKKIFKSPFIFIIQLPQILNDLQIYIMAWSKENVVKLYLYVYVVKQYINVSNAERLTGKQILLM